MQAAATQKPSEAARRRAALWLVARGTNLLWEINGTKGDLLIEGDFGHIQMMPLRMKGAHGGTTRVVDLPVPPSCN